MQEKPATDEKIINPATGKLIKKNGKIGKRLRHALNGKRYTDIQRYQKLVENWEWYRSNSDTIEATCHQEKWFHHRLADVSGWTPSREGTKYPFYIYNYEFMLETAKRGFLIKKKFTTVK